MKPKPTSLMQRATASGLRSIRTPSASRRSAEPESPVAERLPCLATAHPWPAAIRAAVVDTLNVGLPPPVPAVSIRSSRPASTGVANARMVVARPTSSSIVSPLVRSAIRMPEVSTSEALPAMISASTAAVCSALRSWRWASASSAAVRIGLGIGQEVAQQVLAVRRQDGLGMELDADRGERPVAHGHQDAAAVRGGFELVRKGLVHDQRVIARDGQRVGEAGEDALAVVGDRGRLAVHGQMPDDPAAERLAHRLVAEADAEGLDARLGEAAHHLDADAGLVGRARAGAHDDAVVVSLQQLVDRGGVVSDHVEVGPELAQVLDEVVGERVVVVDHQDPHGQAACWLASSIARTTPRAFARDSSYS